jgi:hypothetical protein
MIYNNPWITQFVCKLLFTCIHMLMFLKAVLMKIDAFHYIQMGTVYR